jgi:hypothetical protein
LFAIERPEAPDIKGQKINLPEFRNKIADKNQWSTGIEVCKAEKYPSLKCLLFNGL